MKKDELTINILTTRDEMGEVAARDIADCIEKLLAEKTEINIIFAAAPSQLDMIRYLISNENIEWNRINAFHMDEYIAISKDAPQGFANFLKRHLFDLKPFKSVNCLDCENLNADEECRRYENILKEYPCDIVCMGIGENGHIAFNDPHVANFEDETYVKVVSLDEKCRMQQVNDGCFEKIDDVPKLAMTVTIPALVNAKHLFCVVPCSTKAEAVYNTVFGPISENCPASILRTRKNAIMYCDADSAERLSFEN